MNKTQAEKWIRDYHWMMNTVKMLYEELEDAGSGGVAQYADEAGMPKAQGKVGDVVFTEVVRRGKHWERIAEYKKKIDFIQQNIYVIQEEREVEILHWLLEGKSYAWISRHMGLSQMHTKRICSSIAEQIVENVRNGRCD